MILISISHNSGIKLQFLFSQLQSNYIYIFCLHRKISGLWTFGDIKIFSIHCAIGSFNTNNVRVHSTMILRSVFSLKSIFWKKKKVFGKIIYIVFGEKLYTWFSSKHFHLPKALLVQEHKNKTMNIKIKQSTQSYIRFCCDSINHI